MTRQADPRNDYTPHLTTQKPGGPSVADLYTAIKGADATYTDTRLNGKTYNDLVSIARHLGAAVPTTNSVA